MADERPQRFEKKLKRLLSSLAYHDYEGVALRDEERPRLVRDLGTKNYYMLRNHGLITVADNVPDAFSGQNYWPERLGRHTLYEPVDRGFEREIKKRLDYWEKLRKERRGS